MVETTPELYARLLDQLRALLDGERDLIANAANTSALLYQHLPDVNWVGFYFMRGGELVVGPFQGKPACVRIAAGRGVCGTAVVERRTIVVPDVHDFPGHIPCDVISKSEVVVPMIDGDRVLGVLDVDSPLLNRFGEEDGKWLARCAEVFQQLTCWDDVETGLSRR